MEESILDLLEHRMMFSDLEHVERTNLTACLKHDDNRDLRNYDFAGDDFRSCLVHLMRPASAEAHECSAECSTALRRLAYRCRFLANCYDNQSIAPHDVQLSQR